MNYKSLDYLYGKVKEFSRRWEECRIMYGDDATQTKITMQVYHELHEIYMTILLYN